MIEVVILAAGKGSRMRSALPKVLHKLGGKPFLHHVLDRSRELDASKVHVVVGHGADQVIESTPGDNLNFVEQTEQLGTGHAVQQALPDLNPQSTVLILYGDVPLIKKNTLTELLGVVSDGSMGLLTALLDDSTGYGRIVRDENNNVQAIVEQKDASAEQREIKEINSGVMAVKAAHLSEWLPMLKNNNAQKEYYLTDIISLAVSKGVAVNAIVADDENEIAGVNNRKQQAELERLYQLEIANQLMDNGVTLLDPNRFDCRGNMKVGNDTVIDINCIFEGEVRIGNNVTIEANCIIKNSSIADNTHINANTVIENSLIGTHCNIGPFARIRPGTMLASKAKIGNFVETKKAIIGEGSKVNHLSYVGDAEVGRDVNVGAGTITCNYDGANKHLTKIGDRVFIGSNSALVAPVTVGHGATIGAGATITQDIPEENLAVARTRQKHIAGWKRPTKNKK